MLDHHKMTEHIENKEEVNQLMEREKLIGIHHSLVDLVFADRKLAPVPKPIVSLKTLYTDFVVREISPFYGDKKPLQLEEIPTEENAQELTKTSETPNVDVAPAKRARTDELDMDQVKSELEEKLKPVINNEDFTKLVELVETGGDKMTLTSEITEKANRTLVHQVIRSALKGVYVSVTDNGAISILKATGKEKREDNRRSRPLRARPFLHFTMYKENLENNQVLNIIAKNLTIGVRQIQFCGSKDKRAVTLQRMCIQDMQPARLSLVNSRKSGGNNTVKVCSFDYRNHGLTLGDALGNHFRIVLRVGHRGDTADGALNDASYWSEVQRVLNEVGCINYFGPQRFGTTQVLTSDVGLCLLRKDYPEALRLLLEGKSSFVPEVKQCFEPLQQQRYSEVLELLPHFCYDERTLFRHLVNQPGDYLGAFLSLPRTLAMLYFHAVQSLVWNEIASLRIAKSRAVLPGDMVLEAVYNERLGKTPAVVEKKEDKPLEEVRVLTADEVSHFTIRDIILPVPGPDEALVFPLEDSSSRESYKRHLEKLGIPFLIATGDVPKEEKEASPIGALVKHFHFHGGYRGLVLSPSDFHVSIQSFTGWRTPLTPTDLQAVSEEEAAPEGNGDTNEYKAIIAEFSLPPGCYATCVLREFSRAVGESFHASKS
ncbi:tRNA pseudouridine13 synthase [Angomonas deanei]|nr:tRNA pseudouridine13 synthase [Angomonas deanei]|eukprot:EPY41357.1 tRNA pseudouridine13 synthase [Angomonas deanei]